MSITLFAVLLIAAPGVKDKLKPENPLIGEWVVERAEQNGQDILKIVGPMTLAFQDKNMVMRVMSMDILVPVTIDATTKVKEITLDRPAPAGPVNGIYQIEGDILTICVNAPGEPRPTEFKADGPGVSLYVLKRAQK